MARHAGPREAAPEKRLCPASAVAQHRVLLQEFRKRPATSESLTARSPEPDSSSSSYNGPGGRHEPVLHRNALGLLGFAGGVSLFGWTGSAVDGRPGRREPDVRRRNADELAHSRAALK